jgi:hypothetical protein
MATPDENRAIARIALQRLDRRRQLLEKARGSSRWSWISRLIAAFSVLVILRVVEVFFPDTSYSMMIVLSLLPVIFIISSDVNRAHSRLDALLQLVGEEHLPND